MPDVVPAVPVVGDGTNDVPIGEPQMATIDAILDQRFVEMHARLTHGAQRLQDSNDNVSEQTKLGYLTEERVVGVREAKASTLLQPVMGQPVPVGLSGTSGLKTGA